MYKGRISSVTHTQRLPPLVKSGTCKDRPLPATGEKAVNPSYGIPAKPHLQRPPRCKWDWICEKGQVKRRDCGSSCTVFPFLASDLIQKPCVTLGNLFILAIVLLPLVVLSDCPARIVLQPRNEEFFSLCGKEPETSAKVKSDTNNRPCFKLQTVRLHNVRVVFKDPQTKLWQEYGCNLIVMAIWLVSSSVLCYREREETADTGRIAPLQILPSATSQRRQ